MIIYFIKGNSMKTKKIVLILLVLAVTITMMGCDAISGAFDSAFLKTTEVKSADLDDFSGTVPSTDDEVMSGFGSGMSAFMNAMPMARTLGDDYAPVMKVLELTVPGLAESRTVESRMASASVNASISDETVDSDYTTGDSFDRGDLTIGVAKVSADAEVDSIEKPTKAEAKLDAEVEITMKDIVDYEYNYSTSAYDIVDKKINTMKFNARAKANASSTFGTDGYPDSLDFYAAADVSIGFSLSDPDGPSGKYIFNFNYVQSGTVTESDITSGEYTGDAESVTITIEVYNNDGSLARSVTYTQQELMNMSSAR